MNNAHPNKKNLQEESPKNREGIRRRDLLLSGGSLLAASTLACEVMVIDEPADAQANAAESIALPSDQIGEVAVSAYLYAYPLISMEMARRLSTNVADTRQFAKAPMNQFANVPAFPDATYTDIVRANADTLYSLMWFDVSKEPLLIDVPDSGGRYYLMPMLDMWMDVSKPQARARPGPVRSYLRLPSRAGKANSLRKLCSFVVPPRWAG